MVSLLLNAILVLGSYCDDQTSYLHYLNEQCNETDKFCKLNDPNELRKRFFT